MNGGRFDFDDGGTYCGGWEDAKAHGHGVCTGPKGQGEYAGAWHYGFEVSGVYTWPSGNTFEGQWQNGKRHGLGIERRGRWIYQGEWTQGYKGRYGVRYSTNSQAKYQGTWSSGLQDGYGMETYADGGVYMGQWLRGMRHGYGTRKSAAFGIAAKYRGRSHAHASLTSLRSEQGDDITPERRKIGKSGSTDDAGDDVGGEESRGGFVLRARSEPPQRRRRSLSERSLAVKRTILHGLRIKKQRSTGDIHQRVTSATGGLGSIRSSGSTMSCTSDESYGGGGSTREGAHRHKNTSEDKDLVPPPEEVVEANTSETYSGEWKNDKRSGFGVGERTDGLKYEGEWFNNRKYGYGVTTLKDGTREEGKYKNNVLVTSQRKKHLLFVRSSKLRERIEAAVAAANRAAQIASQKGDIAISRTATARDRSEQADLVAQQSQEDCALARIHAKQFDPTFRQPGTEILKRQRTYEGTNHVPYTPPIRTAASLDTDTQSPSAAQMHHGGGGSGDSGDRLPVQNQIPRSFPIPHQASADSSYGSGTTRPSHDGDGPRTPAATPPMFTPPSELSARAIIDDYHSAATANPTSFPSSLVPNHQNPATHPAVSQQAYYLDYADQQPGPSGLSNRHPNPTSSNPGYHPAHPMGDPYFMTTNPRPTASNPTGQGGSRVSLTMNDHYDQYGLLQMNLARTHQPLQSTPSRPVLKRQTAEHLVPAGGSPSFGAPSMAQRRSTLATARDFVGGLPSPRPPPSDDAASYGGELADGRRAANAIQGGATGSGDEPVEPRGSLPDVSQLATEPVVMSREECARLSSQRRQELQRIAEESELLRSNPLRYIFHPTVKAWIVRWKLPLLVVVVNMCLSLIYLQLLTYRQSGRGGGGDDGTADDDPDS